MKKYRLMISKGIYAVAWNDDIFVEAKDKEEAEKLGANGYLIKPPNPKDYIDFFNGLKKN